MDETERTVVNLTLSSSNDTLITAMHPLLCHKYKYGNKEEAISILNDLFNNLVNRVGLQNILSGDKQPLFIVEDVMEDKLTFQFETYELAETALRELNNI